MKDKVRVYELIDNSTTPKRIMCGTIIDIRNFCKDKWGKDAPFMLETQGIQTEEELYFLLDDDVKLIDFLGDVGIELKELCEVPLEDFQE